MKRAIAVVAALMASMVAAFGQNYPIVVPNTGAVPPATPAGFQQLINGTPWINGVGLVGGRNWRDNYQVIHDILAGMGTWNAQGIYTPSGALPTTGGALTGTLSYGTPPADLVIPASGLNFGISGAANLAVFSDSNTAPAGTVTFPTAVTAQGFLHSPGGQVFALYAPAYCYTAGVCTTEIDAFNNSPADAPSAYPWNRGLGTTSVVPVAITCAGGGPKLNGACMEIASEGSTLGHFQYGITAQAGAAKLADLYFDATATQSPVNTVVFKNSGANGNANILLQTMGSLTAGGLAMNLLGPDGKSYYYLDPMGNQVYSGYTFQSSAFPDERLRNTSAPLNAKIWSKVVDTQGTLHIRATDDNIVAANDAITITRNGFSPAATTFNTTLAEPLATPASSSAPCVTGTFQDDGLYHYVCVSTNKWRRVALSDF